MLASEKPLFPKLPYPSRTIYWTVRDKAAHFAARKSQTIERLEMFFAAHAGGKPSVHTPQEYVKWK